METKTEILAGDPQMRPISSWRSSLVKLSPTLDDLKESILLWTQQDLGPEELSIALKEHFEANGKVFHQDCFYDERMNYFLDELVFVRKSRDRRTAFQLFISHLQHSEQENKISSSPLETISANTQQALAQLAHFRHSLFEIIKIRNQDREIIARDLLDDSKVRILPRDGQIFSGLQKGNTLQAFLFPFSEKMVLGGGVIVHPTAVNRLIKKQLKAEKKSNSFIPIEALRRLARQHLRQLRHSHVDPLKIYQHTR